MTVTCRTAQRFAPNIAGCPTTNTICHLGIFKRTARTPHCSDANLPNPASKRESMLKRTPFHDFHVALGAKMVPFAGFEMPVQYPTGITVEHNAVRQKCGLFDVSHMGEFLITGPQAIDFVNYVTTNNVAALEVGQVHYSGIL